jgi:sugar phosphate isomerase/epimerase
MRVGFFMLQLKLGLQLESLGLPFRQALQTAANLGVSGVEINARRELLPEALGRTGVRHVRKLLGDLNLAVCSIYFPTRRGYAEVADLDKRIDATKSALGLAYELGCPFVVNRIGAIPADDDSSRGLLLQALLDLARHGDRIGARFAARAGDEPGRRLYDLIQSMPSGALVVDFDPGTHVINGHSPEESLRLLAPHVVSFRAYDGVRDGGGRARHVQLGRGCVDFPLLLGLLEQQQFTGYLIVERQAEANAMLECQQTIEYLKSLFY